MGKINTGAAIIIRGKNESRWLKILLNSLKNQNYKNFEIIFDAAAMGQYLGGVDPRNIPGDTTGFINETCIIKYDKYHFKWKEEDNVRRPFLVTEDGNWVRIFNLHIHCKDLEKFI